ncbi:MAG: hypothetical protein WAQ08_01610 [Aquabacterium sp.]|jgi:hypothetical protein|uniref:hypothetical protein n=1 Tax=Aquabacterium sp. TaxID=1872578 RepID=UPI003BB0A3AE
MAVQPAPGALAPTCSIHSTAERELIIDIRQDEWAHFVGTAAQLVSEGLIPESFEWPPADVSKCWEANGFDYWLRRNRPEGHKGPKRSWLELDNWFISVKVTGRDYTWRTRRALERKTEELRAEYYRHTAEGSQEWSASWNRYWQARQDKAFQAFKTRIPGLVPPKRGRKAKLSNQGAQQ